MVEISTAAGSAAPFTGRREEVDSLCSALRRRQSRLIVGPPGIGKTRLLKECLPPSGVPFVCISRPRALHDLLVRIAEALGCRSNRVEHLEKASSVHLKALVLHAVRLAPLCVVLDDLEPADPRMYRFLQELYYVPGTCLMVATRSRQRTGHLRKLLWDPREELTVQPLSRAESLSLFEYACASFQLTSLDLDDFREKALHSAHGNPGQILEMCRLAARPEYRSGTHIKYAPLRIDVLPSFVP